MTTKLIDNILLHISWNGESLEVDEAEITALLDTEVAKARLEGGLTQLKALTFWERWDKVDELPAEIKRRIKNFELADTESNKEGVEVNE